MVGKLASRVIPLLCFLFDTNTQHLLAASPPSAYRISGIVMDSLTGQPLESAEVTIASVINLEDQQAFLTSSDGRFLFVGLPRGKYRLMAGRRGYALQGFQQHEAFMTGIAVGPGLDSEHIRFPLVPSSVITGVVNDDWGDPARDAKVLLFQQNTSEGSRGLRNINQTTTDDQGRYRFAHLLAGTYSVAVYAQPWYAKGQSQSLSQTIDNLQSAVSSADQEGSGANLRQAVGELRQAIAEAAVQSSSSAPFDVVYPITFFPDATSLAEATRFALAPGATQVADLQLRAVPSVHLRVRVPVTPVTITTQQEDGQQTPSQGESSAAAAQVDASPDVALALKIGDSFTDQIEPARKEIAPGIFELSGIPPGQIEVNIMNGPIPTGPEDSIVSHSRTFNLSGDTELDLSDQGESATVSGVVLSSQFSQAAAAPRATPADPATSDHPPGEQTAVVQSASDEAAMVHTLEEHASDTSLTLRSVKTGESYGATLSSEGKFSFAASTLPAGLYEVEFSGQTGLRVSSLEATGAIVSDRTIEIPAGQPVNLTVHAAEANCILSGVALKNGKPVAGAMVLLVPQDPGHDMSLYHRDQSDSDGSFSMSPLFPGRYILLAIENGWDLEWADPKVMFQYLPGGQPLELKPGASLTLNAKVQ